MNLKLDRIFKVDNGTKLKGSATVIIDDCFVVSDIKIIEGDSGLFLAMPNKVLKDGTKVDIVHPINSDARKQFNDLIINAYNDMEK